MPIPDFRNIEKRIQKYYPGVNLTYNWNWPPCPEIQDFYGKSIDSLSEEKFTEELFRKFHEALKDAEKNKDRIIEIINLIVFHWGGIRNNQKTTIATYANYLITCNLKKLSRITGIASKSKVLAAWDPEQYFIYDARVAIALQKLYFDEYKFSIPNPKTGENRKEEIKKLTSKLKESRGDRVNYREFCEGLKKTGKGNRLEKMLFMLGGHIEKTGLA